MRIAVINGSSRKQSQSLRVSNWIKEVIHTKIPENEVDILDLSKKEIREWDEDFWTLKENWCDNWTRHSKNLLKSDAIVVVVPEWGGMVPPALKNLFQLGTNGEFLHKPALIVAISSGNGGSYPVAELRMSSYKNTKICYIPEHIIVRNVEECFDDSNSTNITKQRLHHVLDILFVYAQSFLEIRSNQIISNNKYPYGM